MKRLLLILFFLFAKNLFADRAFVPSTQTLYKKGSELLLGTDYFKTTHVMSAQGKKFQLDDQTLHERIDINLFYKYGLSNHLELSTGTNFRYIMSQYFYSSENFTKSAAGVESISLGAKYSFDRKDRTQFALLGYYKIRPYENKIYSEGEPDQIALGEGSREYGFGLQTSLQTKDANYLGLDIIYRSPGEDLSPEIFSNTYLTFAWNSFAFGLGVEGIFSQESDAYTSDPENKPVVFQGVSNQFNSVNRQSMSPYGHMNLKLGKHWRVESKFRQVVSGRSTDLGYGLEVNLIKRSESDNSFAKKDRKFKQYHIEGEVRKISKTRKLAVLDIGLEDGLEKGMKVDFYYYDFDQGNDLIATGIVLKVSASKAIVKVTKTFGRRRIKKGTIARAGEI